MSINRALSEKIEAYFNENRDNIVSDLCELARVPSIQAAGVPGAPYGEMCNKAIDKAVEIFRRNGFTAENFGGRYGIASYGDGEKTIGLFGHSDVVPVGDDWIYTKPFEPVEIDGILVGRGISDNKSGVIASLYFLKMVKELDIKLKNKVCCFIGGAEETGMDDLDHFISEQKMPDLSLVPDGSFPVSYGEKGICRFWATAPEKLCAVKEFRGGNAFNVVLDNVTVMIEKSDALVSEISEKIAGRSDVTASFDGEDIKLVFRGLTKHAASPEGSLNAAWTACDFLRTLAALPDSDRNVFTYAAFILDGYYGVNLGINHEDSVFGKLTCVNGMTDIKDGKLSISFDIRYGTEKNSSDMTDTIRNTLAKAGWSSNICELEDGFLLPKDGNPFLDKIVAVYRECSGNPEVNPTVMSGGTYSRKLKNAYSIGTSAPYKVKKLDLPAGHGGAHQSDETLCVDAYLEAMKIIALMAIGCDELL